jgi:hypothetical protein
MLETLAAAGLHAEKLQEIERFRQSPAAIVAVSVVYHKIDGTDLHTGFRINEPEWEAFEPIYQELLEEFESALNASVDQCIDSIKQA